MEEKMTQYLKSIGITEIVEKRVNELLTQVENITKEKAVDIIVLEYVNEDGMKIYEALRIWTDNFKMMISNFLTDSEFVISPIYEKMRRIEISAKDFDYIESSTNSRIFIVGISLYNMHAPMKGSGINCEYIMEAFHKYFVPCVHT